MKKLKIACIAALVLACTLTVLLPLRASAAEAGVCSLTWYTPTQYAADLVETDYQVSLFRVASADTWDGEYKPTDSFKDLDLSELNKSQSVEALAAAAEAALELADTLELEPDAELTVKSGLNCGTVTGLLRGLYVLRMEGAQSKEWVYSAAPVAVFLPATREETHDENSIRVNDDTATDLYYDLEIYGKLLRERRLGDLVIEKHMNNMQDFSGCGAAYNSVTCVFRVVGVLEEDTIYDEYLAICFDKPGEKTAVVKDLPVGTEVTVTEVYSGAGAHVLGIDSLTVTITGYEADDPDYFPISVMFENDGGGIIRGSGAVNYYESTDLGWAPSQKDGDNSGSWEPPADAPGAHTGYGPNSGSGPEGGSGN